jgi:hypothetical protein
MSIKQIKGKIADFVRNIPEDKKLHLIAGVGVCGLVSLFLGYLIGLVVTLVAGAGKEAYDYLTKKGTPEFADFVYTAIGAVCFIVLSASLTWLLYFCMKAIF